MTLLAVTLAIGVLVGALATAFLLLERWYDATTRAIDDAD
jgi:hypothetical protein